MKLSSSQRISDIDVKMGSFSVSDLQNSALTTFVGSCIALCIYEPEAKIGGLAHVMLPSSEGKYQPAEGYEAKYADHALSALLENMNEKGARKEILIAKLVGGAKTFTNENSNADMFRIGERNYSSIRSLLASSKIPVIAESIGSTKGRWVRLDVNTGAVVVKSSTSEAII
ncbi:MAG: chemotaxis protein CheD [Thermoproteota archaeon]